MTQTSSQSGQKFMALVREMMVVVVVVMMMMMQFCSHFY
jgi:hypothetical protein